MKFLELQDIENTIIDISVIKIVRFREIQTVRTKYSIYIYTTLYNISSNSYLEISYTDEFLAKEDYEKIKKLLNEVK